MRAGSGDVDGAIVLTHKVDLGSADDPGTFHHRAQVAFWSPVGYAVGPTFEPGFIYVYDANGNWLRRLGGPGAGPGEIGPAVLTHLRVLLDTLWVAVPGRRRLTGFPADGGPPVTLDGPVVTRGFLIGPSQIIVNTVKEGIPTLAFLDREGRVHSEVASDSTTLRQGGQQSITGDGTDGRLWVGKVTPYDIEQWGRGGRVLSRIERSPDWYDPPDPGNVDLTALVALWEHDDLLWALTVVAQAPAEATGQVSSSPWDGLLDTVLEVLDPETGRVIETFRDDRAFFKVSGAHELSHIHELESGDFRMQIFSIGRT
jgi:hypothetical protein